MFTFRNIGRLQSCMKKRLRILKKTGNSLQNTKIFRRIVDKIAEIYILNK